MKIYKVSVKNGYLELQFKNYHSDKMLLKLLSEDKSVLEEWGMPEVDIITKGKKSDCPFFWASMQLVVVSEKAKEELKDVWKYDNIELLPLICGADIYYMIHIMQTENISYELEKDIIFDKKECEQYNITNKFLFRAYIGEFRYKGIFVNEKFIERVENSNLKGFRFEKIWEG